VGPRLRSRLGERRRAARRLHEAPRTGGFGGEIVATVAERALDSLRAPILRVTGFDTPFPYALEHVYMPDQNAGHGGGRAAFH
jgi:pyruvate/2-oxoglutarate/acetoin dehydrogenase E1 component